jgi:predicted enzyme related to lactoylglutathione lyase
MATSGSPPNWTWNAGPEAGTAVVFYATYVGSNYGPVPQYCNPKTQVYYQAGAYWDVPAAMYAPDCAPSQQKGFVIEYEADTIPPSANLVSPNGGEVLQPGTMVPIQCFHSDAFGHVASLDIQLSRSGPGGPFENIVTNLPASVSAPQPESVLSTTTFSWCVTGPSTSNAYLRIIVRDEAGNEGNDLSDSPFTILAGESQCPTPAAPMSWGRIKGHYR